MNSKTTLFFSLILLAFAANSQIQSVSGTISMATGESVYGSAVVLSPTDSSLIDGTTFWEGDFEIDNINQEQGMLKLSSLEFEDHFMTLTFDGHPHIDLGSVTVKSSLTELEEVIVTARKPLTINRGDGSLELEIQNSPLSTSTSAEEILRRSPGIIVDQDNNFQVVGKGAATIYVNGKRVDNARLSTISPSSIKSIQIISNPGPKYDAEGNAVIDIITTKPDQGTSASLKNYYTVNGFSGNDNRTNISLNHHQGKWSGHGDYGLQTGNYRQILRTTRERTQSGDYFLSDLETDWQYDYEHFSNYSGGLQYDINDQSYISAAYTGAYERLGGNQLSFNTITTSSSGDYESQIDVSQVDKKNSVNGNYYVKFDSSQSSLFLGSQYSTFEFDVDNLISNQSRVGEDVQQGRIGNTGQNRTEIFSIQADHRKQLGSLTLESGLKYWDVQVNAFNQFQDILEDSTVINQDLSNDFQYVEKVGAAYLNLEGQLSQRLRYTAGMRVEATSFTLNSSQTEQASISRSYRNYFPSASLRHSSGEFESFFSFASRINRASYSQLNPFVIYQDQFTTIQGNPNISPTRTYSFELGTSARGWNVKMAYNHAIDAMQGGAFQSGEDDRVYVLQRYNMSLQKSYLFSISKSLDIEWWQSVNTFSTTWARLEDHTGAFVARGYEPFFYLYTQQSVDIGSLFRLYITAAFQSNKQDGIYLRKHQGFVNTGIEKRLWQDKLKINMELNDLFYTRRAAGEYQIGETYIRYGRQFNSQFFRLSVSMDLGDLTKKSFKNKGVGDAAIRRAQ